MGMIIRRCPKCEGQIKIKDTWERAFCLYCGTKVENNYVELEVPENDPSVKDELVEEAITQAVEVLSSSDLKKASDIQRIAESLRSRFKGYNKRFRSCGSRYAKQINNFYHNVSGIPYETTVETWEELKKAVSDLEIGCAICMAYNEFSDTYLSCVDKLQSVMRMKWEAQIKKGNIPDITKKDFFAMRERVSSVESWLRFYCKS